MAHCRWRCYSRSGSSINNMETNYSSWTVQKLKVELLRRGAALRGRKIDLVERDDVFSIDSMCQMCVGIICLRKFVLETSSYA